MSHPRHDSSPLLDHCPAGLPAHVYHDADWFKREQQAIWAKNWVYVGRANDIAPGSMRRVSVAGDSLIICRSSDGRISAFHNSCRHRGAELCTVSEKPMGKLITCPYHAWSYAADDGRLISVAAAAPTRDFAKADHGLFRVAVHQWNGFVYVCLSDTPPEFEPDVGTQILDNWPMESLITGHRMDHDIACNWKVFWENYNECLHCPGVHPELCDMVPIYGQGIMSPSESANYHPDAPTPARLKHGAVTWTATGAACGPEFAGLTDAERSAGYLFVTLLPTHYIVAHVDYVRVVTITPTGPETMRLTAEWLFSPETLAQPGFDAANVAAFAKIVMTQDAEVSEINQRGLRSSKFAHARLMPQEFDIAHFHQWVMRQMEATKP